jgi:hypothetical protein
MPAEHNPFCFRLGPRLFPSPSNDLHSCFGNFMLRISRPPRLLVALWQIREENEAHYCKRQRDVAVNNEEPSERNILSDQ